MSTIAPYIESWLAGPLSTSFYTRLYQPDSSVPLRGALVFVHGYIEHIGRYTAFHARWASHGIAVFAYDERGFGRTALDEKKSPGSVYGQTGGMRERMMDVEWAVKHTKDLFKNVPLFLMGHSMGGGQVLGFATRTQNPPEKETISLLSGVIASSPLVRIARTQPSPIVLKALNLGSKFFPNASVKTPVQDKDLSQDPKVGEDSLKDPWIKPIGTLGGLADMIRRGELLLSEGYKCWPSDLPVLILHGTVDMVNLFSATQDFYEILQAPDKQFIIYPDIMHDLMTEPAIKDKYFEDCLSWVEGHLST